MDPEACLRDADQHFSDGYISDALDSLRNYAEWRFRGGFQPPDGDARYSKLMLYIIEEISSTECQ